MLNLLFFIIMILVPPVFAVVIHSYLTHGDMSGRKRLILFAVYTVIINLLCYAVSCLRGVSGFDYANMTVSYRLKFLGLGCVLGFVIPFFVCLAVEERITLGGFKRYFVRFAKDLKKYLPYAIWSARADLGSEVANSYLNWLWWMIEPFCMMLIYTVIFGFVFKAREEYFPVFVFTGITMWGFFSRTVNGSINTVRANKDVITKVYMPKYILLLSKMLVNGFKMLVSFGVIAVMMIVFRVPVDWHLIFILPVLVILFLFTFGVGTILMHYGVYVNDLGYITGIVLQMLMYLTGVFYSVSKRIPAPFGELLENFNPVACMISSLRNAMMYRMTPPLALLGIWAFLSLILIALGVFTIYSNENAYVKVI